MSASVSVGFSPASSGTVALPGGDASTQGDAAGGNVFSMLLDLLGAGLAPAVADAAKDLPAVPAELSALFDTLGAAPAAAPGKSLLQSLGDALVSAGDSLASGKTLDEAQDKRLREALDAVAAALGGLPAAIAQQPAPTATEPAPTSGSPLDPLSQLLSKLSGDLRSGAPELADRLDALAAQVKSKGATPALLESLGLSDDITADIAKLVEAFKSAHPASKPAADAPLAAPVLPAATDLTTKSTSAADADIAAPTPAHAAVRLEKADTAPASDKPAAARGDQPPAAPDAAKSAPDAATATQSTQSAPSAPVAQPARVAHAAYQSPLQQVNIPQVAFELVRQFQAGNSRFQIRLDPPELGRIDVKLDLDRHGTVNARMVVERPETLDLMQRDQRALQQALTQAGLDTGKTNLEFSLRQSPFAHDQGTGGQGQQGGSYGATAGTTDEASEAPTTVTTYYRGTASAGGVNLFV